MASMTSTRLMLSNKRRGILGLKDGRPCLYDAEAIDEQIRLNFDDDLVERQKLLNLLDDFSTANGGW